MEKLQTQASKLWQLLFDPETATTYQKMLALTGVILKETALLLWLFFCSIFVLGAWLGKTGLSWGRDTRNWLDDQTASEADSSEKAAATGQALLDAGQSGAYFLLDKAYEQLGLEKPTRPEKPAVTANPSKTAKTTKASNGTKATAGKPPAAKVTAAKTGSTTVTETRVADKPLADDDVTA